MRASIRCQSVTIGGFGEASPGAGCVCQLGDDDCSEYCFVCITVSHNPWALNSRSAYKLWKLDLSIFPIGLCSDAQRFLVKVTPYWIGLHFRQETVAYPYQRSHCLGIFPRSLGIWGSTRDLGICRAILGFFTVVNEIEFWVTSDDLRLQIYTVSGKNRSP